MSDSNDSHDVRHEPEQSRFVVDLDEGQATARYGRRDGIIVLMSTEVPESAEGEGVGSALARAALGYARSEGLKVDARCPFMASYIRRHPEYQDLQG